MKKYIFFIFFFFGLVNGFAQSNRRITGTVIDSAKTAIDHISVILIDGTDTLRTTTDDKGLFSFNKIKAASFSITIEALGYHAFHKQYEFGKSKQLDLNDIILKPTAYLLKAVEIKAKPNPIRIMQDTIEYNAAAFRVEEGDNVADLMKQFPGLEIDDEYNVKTQGKEMVKLRVNGQDFFTSNVKDFIAKLPAEIVSKIQVIDDYGDQANFTGIKTGEPTKMLNIVTKPGMNKGKFGSSSLSGGTNNQLGGALNMNLWNGTQQRMAMLNYSTSDNGAGTSTMSMNTINHRDKIGKNGNLSLNYNFNTTHTAFEREQNVSTLNPLGPLNNLSNSNGKGNQSSHSFSSGYNFNNKKIFVNSSFSLSYRKNKDDNSSFNQQTGILRQDLRNQSQSSSSTPSVSAYLNWSKKLTNKRNSLSANFGFSSSGANNDQSVSTNRLYYDNTTQLLQKDSVLTRDILTTNQNQNVNFSLQYAIGLRKSTVDSLLMRSISINYSANMGKGSNEIATYVYNPADGQSRFVDSLSSRINSLFITQSLGLGYNYSRKNFRYTIGFNARPNLMQNNYRHLDRRISNNTFNYSPNFNLSKTFAKGKTLSLNYGGSSNAPSISQMQPIRNTQNLQNIVVGNPDLKPYFNHRVSASLNYVHTKTGISFTSGLNFNATQNEIVSSIRLIPDTLNTYRQETHFENTNGTYSTGANYTLNLPWQKNKFSVSYSGTLGFSNRAVFINDNRRFNKGLNFSQRLSGRFNLKKFSGSMGGTYSLNSNTNILNSGMMGELYGQNPELLVATTFSRSHNYGVNFTTALRLKSFSADANASYNSTHNEGNFNNNALRNINRLQLSATTQYVIRKVYSISLSASKQVNKGYAVSNVNPLLINSTIRRAFLKNKTLSVSISGRDLLNQGNNLSRTVSGSSIIDSRSNLITRVFSFGLSYNLSSFGGRNIRVDNDVIVSY